MDNTAFVLRRSRLALLFQILIFVILNTVLYVLLPLWLWLICFVLAALSAIICLRLPASQQLQYLDEREWSLSSTNSLSPQRVSISHVIDHQIYIVIYFQYFQQKPLLIWCDQVSWREWKKLKTLAKLI